MKLDRARGRRFVPALMALTVASLVGVMPVSAAVDHSGTYGVHALIDTADFSGVICNYPVPTPNTLRSIRIRRPIVYGVDRTPGRDQQTVGWRFRIWYSESGGPWQLGHTSTVAKATATDAYNAQWSGRLYTIPDPELERRYRVDVRMDWYWPSGTASEGWARHAPRYYGVRIPDGTIIGNGDNCGWTTG